MTSIRGASFPMTARRVLPLLTLAAALAAASPASATTFCVPGFHAACPDSGGNVALTGLEAAMQTSGDDGIDDRIVIAPGTISEATNYELDSGDDDDLEIVGAGPDQTAITTSASGNVFVMNLNGGRAITMRDLTIRIPASLTDNGGGALQSEQDTFVNVDIESRNVRSDGANSMIGGSTFTDGRLYGSNGGSIDVGFSGNGAESGTMTIERTVIEGPSWGIVSDDPEVTVNVRRVAIYDPLAYGIRISDGAFASVHNSIVESTTGIPITAESTDSGTVIASVRHVTIAGVDLEPGEFAIQAKVHDEAGNGPVNLVVRDSIVAGYEDPLRCEAPDDAGVGDAILSVGYSWFFHSATVLGDCNVTNPNTIDAFDPDFGEPQFAPGGYQLPGGSPAVDGGDPATVTLPTTDFLGAPRPIDGDGDGTAVRDMGAYEVQPAAPPPDDGGGMTPPPPGGGVTQPPPAATVDVVAPRISKLRLARLPSSTRRGRLRLSLSEPARVVVTLKRVDSRRRAARQAFTARKGANALRLRKRRLAPGAYRLTVVAIDEAGNRSKPVRRSRAKS
jgi:hypothetical protein